ncbi:MAG: hypothetical protein ABI112_06065, partial [Terracoccus sp.]
AWDAALIAEGRALVDERLRVVAAGGERPGRYQLLAAINTVHTGAASTRDTDWSRIVALYDAIVRLDPSPVVRLNRASTGPSPSSTDHWSAWPRSTASVTPSRATTPSTSPGRSCYAASVAAARRGRHTTAPST